MSFLPKDYELPQSASGYMKFEQGDNKFRIMSSPILGYEWWVNKDGEARLKGEKPAQGDKPMRCRMDGKIPVEAADSYKHFWAMIVWNYKSSSIQILQITQASIQSAIKSIVNDEDWGDPKGNDGYDIVVTRSGEGLETTYSVVPKPKRELADEIIDAYRSKNINLSALYDGEDPFNSEIVSTDDVPEDL